MKKLLLSIGLGVIGANVVVAHQSVAVASAQLSSGEQANVEKMCAKDGPIRQSNGAACKDPAVAAWALIYCTNTPEFMPSATSKQGSDCYKKINEIYFFGSPSCIKLKEKYRQKCRKQKNKSEECKSFEKEMEKKCDEDDRNLFFAIQQAAPFHGGEKIEDIKKFKYHASVEAALKGITRFSGRRNQWR